MEPEAEDNGGHVVVHVQIYMAAEHAKQSHGGAPSSLGEFSKNQ